MPEYSTTSPLPPWLRSDYNGALRAADAGRAVALWGWVASRRDHGGLIFIDLRDYQGIVQLVFNPERDPAAHAVAEKARAEYYLAVKGTVVRRSENTINRELPTGEVEVVVTEAQILASSAPHPSRSSPEAKRPPRSSGCAIATSTCGAPRCNRICAVVIRRCAACAPGSTARVSSRSKRRSCGRRRPKARATIWCRAASIRESSTRCPNRRNC